MAQQQKLKEHMRPGDAIALFNKLAAKKELAFEYVIDGCYARAHFMCKDIEDEGVKAYKSWIDGNGRDINVTFKGAFKVRVAWNYHVAPTVKVQADDDQPPHDVVLDPSMFDGPVTKDEWAHAMEGEKPELVKVSRFQQASPNGEPNGYLNHPKKLSTTTVDEHAEKVVRHCRKKADEMFVILPVFKSKWMRDVKVALAKKAVQSVASKYISRKKHEP